MPAEKPPCLVGLTGGLASGKSSVAEIFRKRNIPIRDADGIVHRLYEAGQAGSRLVRELFGDSMFDESGAVNRRALATRIMRDEEAKTALEEAIHPLVRGEISNWARKESAPILVVEAALLIETGAASNYDLLIAVLCGRKEQRRRAIARGMPPEQVDAILDLQTTEEIRRRSADVIIDNSGKPEELAGAVDRAWTEVLGLCREIRGV